MAQDLNLNQRLIVTDTDGVRVTGITSGTYLEISGNLPGYTAGQYPVLKSGGTIHFGVNGLYRAYLEGNDTYFGILNNSSVTTVLLKTSGSSYLNGGNVGIGTTSPSAKLHVNPSTTNEIAILINGTQTYSANNYQRISAGDQYSSNRAAIGFGYNSSTQWDIKYSSYSNHSFWTGNDWGSSTEKMRITSAGNVGIGTTSPSKTLVVNGETWINQTSDYFGGGTTVQISAGGTGGVGIRSNTFYLYPYSSNNAASLVYGYNDGGSWRLSNAGGNDRFDFYSYGGSTTVLSLASSGNVGIGTTSPSFQLDVSNSIGFNGRSFKEQKYLELAGNARNALWLDRTSFSNGYSSGAVNIVFPNTYMQGYLKITLSDSYSNQNITGALTKLIPFGWNLNGSIWGDGSNYEITEAVGGIATDFTIGDIAWDSSSSKYYIPIYKLSSNGNGLKVRVEYFGENGSALTGVALSSVYQTTPPSKYSTRHYQNINDGLGIGTTSPADKLEVSSSGNVYAKVATTTTGGYNAGIKFLSSGAREWGIFTDGDLRFYDFSGSSERMRITASGDVGISTTSPAYKLDVVGTGRFKGNIALITDADSGNYSLIQHNYGGSTKAFSGYNSGFAIYGGESGVDTRLQAGGQYGLSIKNDTLNVGIGTTSPQTKLEVDGSTNSFVAHFGQGQDNGDGSWGGISVGYGETSNSLYRKVGIVAEAHGDGAARQHLHFLVDTVGDANSATLSDSKMMIDGFSGNVGIGTTSPDYRLTVENAIRVKTGIKLTENTSTLYATDGALSYYSTTNGVYLNGAGTNGWLRLNAAGTENYQNCIDIYGGSAGAYMIFRTNNSERMLITSGGNVGIGTTSPAEKLQVAGNIGVHPGQKFGWIYNPGTDNNMYNFIQTAVNGGVSASPLEISGSRWTSSNTAGVIFTHQTGGQIMTIMTGGNVGIGTTSPAYKLDVSGGAIAIRGNAAGNSLRFDDSLGTSRNAMYVDTSNYLNIGNSNYAGVKFVQTATAPNTGAFDGQNIQQAVGTTDDGVVLAAPDAWLAVRVGTTDYAIPMYTTG